MQTAEWQKSSFCGQGESCVHVAANRQAVLLTESADPSHATLNTTPATLAALLLHIKADHE
ncbi:DUF397 domain-containing protein [Streptomyces sp. ISL-96]|uniref:DUF397 domain-containing protein n=1 Tax=Streptomyces sp. ISL-96 TaxID=2819191 RepID=UPI001BE69DF1|nr:DUF397 domain-containing protein [Streptomyces sp. ISL-96]MBT2489073.1 DUF397 domain-containing protein [Streptomyces sp. ISL-96]